MAFHQRRCLALRLIASLILFDTLMGNNMVAISDINTNRRLVDAVAQEVVGNVKKTMTENHAHYYKSNNKRDQISALFMFSSRQ